MREKISNERPDIDRKRATIPSKSALSVPCFVERNKMERPTIRTRFTGERTKSVISVWKISLPMNHGELMDEQQRDRYRNVVTRDQARGTYYLSVMFEKWLSKRYVILLDSFAIISKIIGWRSVRLLGQADRLRYLAAK